MKKKRLLLMSALLFAASQGAWADTWDGMTYTKPKHWDGNSYGQSNIVAIENAAELAYVMAHFDEETGYDQHTGSKRRESHPDQLRRRRSHNHFDHGLHG